MPEEEHDEVTNEEKAAWAEETLLAYAEISGLPKDDTEAQITDLLADLQHYCSIQDLDFDEMLKMSRVHYQDEISVEEEDEEEAEEEEVDDEEPLDEEPPIDEP